MIAPLSGIEPLHPSQATIQFYLSDELTRDLSTQLDLNILSTTELSDFIDFVDDETLLASDPLFSQEALKQYNERKEKGTRELKSYVSHAAEPAKNERDVSSGNDCPVCEKRHDLNNCRQFNDLTLEERRKILRKKKLCYDCYSPITSEHNAKSCKKQRKRRDCNLDHPTGLHGYIDKKRGGALTNDTEEKQGGGNLKSNFAGMDFKSA